MASLSVSDKGHSFSCNMFVDCHGIYLGLSIDPLLQLVALEWDSGDRE